MLRELPVDPVCGLCFLTQQVTICMFLIYYISYGPSNTDVLCSCINLLPTESQELFLTTFSKKFQTFFLLRITLSSLSLSSLSMIFFLTTKAAQYNQTYHNTTTSLNNIIYRQLTTESKLGKGIICN